MYRLYISIAIILISVSSILQTTHSLCSNMDTDTSYSFSKSCPPTALHLHTLESLWSAKGGSVYFQDLVKMQSKELITMKRHIFTLCK